MLCWQKCETFAWAEGEEDQASPVDDKCNWVRCMTSNSTVVLLAVVIYLLSRRTATVVPATTAIGNKVDDVNRVHPNGESEYIQTGSQRITPPQYNFTCALTAVFKTYFV